MYKPLLNRQVCRAIIPIGYRSLHTTPSVHVKARYLKSVERVQKHFARLMKKPKPAEIDPILGKPYIPFIERVKARVSEPNNLIMNMSTDNTATLFYGAEKAALLRQGDTLGHLTQPILESEKHKREAVERIVSLQNASQQAVKRLGISYAVNEFQRFEGDTGSSEVQAAIATIKIHYLTNHLKENHKNNPSLRKLEMMVQGRQRILKYLKETDPKRYFWTIEKLGLTDESVVNEFHLSRKYLARVKFFGDRTLPERLNKKEKADLLRIERMKKKARRFLK